MVLKETFQSSISLLPFSLPQILHFWILAFSFAKRATPFLKAWCFLVFSFKSFKQNNPILIQALGWTEVKTKLYSTRGHQKKIQGMYYCMFPSQREIGPPLNSSPSWEDHQFRGHSPKHSSCALVFGHHSNLGQAGSINTFPSDRATASHNLHSVTIRALGCLFFPFSSVGVKKQRRKYLALKVIWIYIWQDQLYKLCNGAQNTPPNLSVFFLTLWKGNNQCSCAGRKPIYCSIEGLQFNPCSLREMWLLLCKIRVDWSLTPPWVLGVWVPNIAKKDLLNH